MFGSIEVKNQTQDCLRIDSMDVTVKTNCYYWCSAVLSKLTQIIDPKLYIYIYNLSPLYQIIYQKKVKHYGSQPSVLQAKTWYCTIASWILTGNS